MSIPKKIIFSGSSGILERNHSTYRWQKDGWNPFFIYVVLEIDKCFLQVQGAVGSKNITLYISISDTAVLRAGVRGKPNRISKENIAHARQSADHEYEVSFITFHGTPVSVRGFTVLFEARAAKKKSGMRQRGIVTNPKHWITTKGHEKTTSYNTSNFSKAIPRQQKTKGSRSVMAIAFAEAINNKKGKQ